MDSHVKGYIFAILSSLLMTSAFVISYMVLQKVSVATMTFYFFGFGLVGALVAVMITGKLGKAKHLLAKHWKALFILGMVGGTTAIFFFFALKLVGSSTLGFMMRFSTVFTVAMGVIYLKEAFNKGEMLGAVVMIIGALVMTFKGGEHIIAGLFIALGISLAVSLEQFFMKNYVKRIEPIVLNALRLLFTFLVVSVYTMARMDLAVPPLDVLFLIFLGSVLAVVIGFVFYFKALEIAELSKVATIRAIDPFVILIYSLIFLGSVPTGLQLAGGVLVGAGALFLVVSRHKPQLIERLLPNF